MGKVLNFNFYFQLSEKVSHVLPFIPVGLQVRGTKVQVGDPGTLQRAGHLPACIQGSR
jgi:hypothetical protein